MPLRERTTAQIRQQVAGSPQVNRQYGPRLLTILDDCDLVKFAKVTPNRQEAEQLLREARQLVLDSKPQPVTTEKNNPSGPDKPAPNEHALNSQMETTL